MADKKPNFSWSRIWTPGVSMKRPRYVEKVWAGLRLAAVVGVSLVLVLILRACT